MSETSRTHAQQAAVEIFGDDVEGEVEAIIERHIAAALAEQTAPLYRAIRELSYLHQVEGLWLGPTSEGEEIIAQGMKLLGIQDLSADALPAPPANSKEK